ncbi:MAG TPA: hypothetical protein VK358_11290 [Longimicrobium sp.]|nr:hypothetical protein [Longimicrobium sp.]
MDSDDEDPDSAGPVHPSVFYGLWPRFTADDRAAEPGDAEPARSTAD